MQGDEIKLLSIVCRNVQSLHFHEFTMDAHTMNLWFRLALTYGCDFIECNGF